MVKIFSRVSPKAIVFFFKVLCKNLQHYKIGIKMNNNPNLEKKKSNEKFND